MEINDITTVTAITDEILKCRESPYYFATKYLKIVTPDGKEIPYKVALTEKEFNNMIWKLI